MQVLVSASTFPVDPDEGTPRFVYDLATALAEEADVSVLVPHVPGSATEEKRGKLSIHRFRYFWPASLQRLTPHLGQGMVQHIRQSWLSKFQIPFLLCKAALQTWRLVRQKKIDVVNAHWIVPQGMTAAWALGRKRRCKLVLHVHAGDVYLLHKLPGGKRIAQYVIDRTDIVFADGSHVRDHLDMLLKEPAGTIIQSMGVRRELFQQNAAESAPAETTKFAQGYLLFVGRLVEKKGVPFLLDAMPEILKQFPEMGLIIVGTGEDEAALKQQMNDLGIGNQVVFVGQRSHDDIVNYLHHCKLATVPSIIDRHGETEGMPTVVVEAMTAGVCVVGSRVNGIPDVIVDGENGWLCEPKNSADLAEKILLALNSPKAESIVDSALKTSVRHSWKQVAENYLEQIYKVLPQGGNIE